jgi:hypothetical protein
MTDVLLSTEDLLVIGPPSQITVDLDLGAKGERGSRIFSYILSDPILGMEEIGQTPIAYDMYISLDRTGSEYLTVYQYVSNGIGGYEWQKVFNFYPNELRKNYQLSFTEGIAIKTINVTDIIPLSLVSTVEAENFNIVYSIENQNPIATSIDSVSVVVDEETEFINLEITIKAIEYKDNSWVAINPSNEDTGIRIVHLDIRVV